MDFTLTDDQQLLRDTARKLLDARVPAVARARAHRRPRRVPSRCGRTSREYAALGARARDRPVPLPRGDRLRRRARTVPRRPRRCSRSLDRRGRRRGRSPIAGASGDWAPNDDPVKTFVLEADRVDRIAIDRRRPDAVGRRPPPDDRAALRVDGRLLAPRLRARHRRGRARTRSRSPPKALAAWLDRAHVVARGRDGRHRPPDLHDGARVRQGTRAVRRADRQLPGDPAQARRDVARARAGDRAPCTTPR